MGPTNEAAVAFRDVRLNRHAYLCASADRVVSQIDNATSKGAIYLPEGLAATCRSGVLLWLYVAS